MKKKILLFIVFLFSLHKFSIAGQIVTPEIRAWAQKAIAQEQELSTIFAPNTLGVLYFKNLTSDPELTPLEKGFTLMLITDLSKVKRLQVVERVRLQALLDELKLSVSGLMSPDTAPRLGRLLQARWLVGGQFKGSPETLEFESQLFDVPKTKISADIQEKGKLETIFEIEKKLLFALIDRLQIELTPKEKEELRKPVTKSVKALLLLSKGLEASDRGNYQEAAKYYRKALREDPNFSLAKKCFQELVAKNLVRIRRTLALLRGLRAWTSFTDRLRAEYPNFRLKHPLVEIPTIKKVDEQIEIVGIYVTWNLYGYYSNNYYTPNDYPSGYSSFQDFVNQVIAGTATLDGYPVSSYTLDTKTYPAYLIFDYPIKGVKYYYYIDTGEYKFIKN